MGMMKAIIMVSTISLVLGWSRADQGPPKIITILNEFPQFSIYKDLISKYGLAKEMNDWSSLTVLVVDNAAMGAITKMNPNKAKDVLSLHAYLEFYDPKNLETPSKNVMMLTSLLMTTGNAHGQRGFVTAVHKGPGPTLFGSAMNGAQHKAVFVRPIKVEPNVISVVQISEPIIPPGS